MQHDVRKTALITGATGQDGHYLARLLTENGYDVHLQTRGAIPAEDRLEGATEHRVDLTDRAAMEELCVSIQPDEIYNLAAISRPQESWDRPFDTGLINAMLPHHLLETIRLHLPACKFYQASSSEMFGNTLISPQDEFTPFQPQSPYAITKVYAHQLLGAYRIRYGIFACAGILFNHDSPRRPLSFVTQKIAHAAALVGLGIRNSTELDERGEPILSNGHVSLGNLDVSRDFGYAGDYVRAMWLMMQQDKPGDYVIGTGETHSIRDICEIAFAHVGRNWQDHTFIDPQLVRHVDTRYTIADASKARRVLGWSPTISFAELITMMVDARTKLLSERGAGPSEEVSHG